jgi:hypothetical protein
MDPAGIPALQEAVRHLHGADSKHVYTEHVHEVAPTGELVADLDVEVFELVGDRVTGVRGVVRWSGGVRRCYAWSEATTGAKRRFFVVLGLEGIDSAAKAVRASILADARGKTMKS